MAKPVVQLMIVSQAQLREKALAPRTREEFTEFPAIVSVGEGGELFRLEEKGEAIVLVAGKGVEVRFAGEAMAVKERELHTGMEWTAGEWNFRVAFQRQSAGISFWSQALARFARVLVLLFFLVQLWVMFGLQGIVLNSGILDNSTEKLRMMKQVEALQARAAKVKVDTPLKRSILAAIQDDVEARMRFLKNYENVLRRSERRQMREDCTRLGEMLDILETDESFGAVEPLDVDGAVKRVLEIRE